MVIKCKSKYPVFVPLNPSSPLQGIYGDGQDETDDEEMGGDFETYKFNRLRKSNFDEVENKEVNEDEEEEEEDKNNKKNKKSKKKKVKKGKSSKEPLALITALFGEHYKENGLRSVWGISSLKESKINSIFAEKSKIDALLSKSSPLIILISLNKNNIQITEIKKTKILSLPHPTNNYP